MQYSEELRALREIIGYNIKTMSEVLEIPYTTYQSWELGLREPPAWQQRLVKNEIKRLTEEKRQKDEGYRIIKVRRK